MRGIPRGGGNSSASQVNWTWQIPAIPVAFLLLGAVLITAGKGVPGTPLRWAYRAPIAIAGMAVVISIAVPAASTSFVPQSQSEVQRGDLVAALGSARTAGNVQPGAASPRLQEALVLELGGNLEAAALAANEAVEGKLSNWRAWFVLSILQALQGQVELSINSFSTARNLNARGITFDD